MSKSPKLPVSKNDAANIECMIAKELELDSSENAVESHIDGPDEDLRPDDLESQLSEVTATGDMFMKNEFFKLRQVLSEKASRNMYHALWLAMHSCIRPMMTFKKEHFAVAKGHAKSATVLAHKYRKPGIMKLVYINDYDSFTDEEAHAELCYADAQMITSIVSALTDQSITGFIAAAARIKFAYQAYKLCYAVMQSKTNWTKEIHKQTFESGVRLGYGGFDLAISFLPRKLAMLLEFVGFSGNRIKGEHQLQKAYEIKVGPRFPGIFAGLAFYRTGVEFVYGLGNYDKQIVEDIMLAVQNYSDSNTARLTVASYYVLGGKLDDAIKVIRQVAEKHDMKEQAYFCYLMMMLCYVTKGEWKEAADCMNQCKDKLRWSRAVFTYIYAILRYKQMEETKDDSLKPEILANLKKVPEVKRHFGGKLAFHEKLVLERSRKYGDEVNQLLFPEMELMYIWNYFYILRSSKSILEWMLSCVENKMTEIKPRGEKRANLIFLKGVILRHIGRTKDAVDCFKSIRQRKHEIKEETHLVPQATFEIAMVYKEWGNHTLAKEWLLKAKKYQRYLTETLITFRIETALIRLRESHP